VSRTTAERVPSSAMPMIGGLEVPSACRAAPAKRPWLDSTRPIPANSDQSMPQAGSLTANTAAACL
jgi:hypothetical protein